MDRELLSISELESLKNEINLYNEQLELALDEFQFNKIQSRLMEISEVLIKKEKIARASEIGLRLI